MRKRLLSLFMALACLVSMFPVNVAAVETDVSDPAVEEVETCEHVYDSVVTAPTCTEPGFTTYTCSACGDTYTADETAALGHTETAVEAVPATCTEPGLTAGTACSVCSVVLTAQEAIEATGHSYETIVTEPTCTEPGYTTYTCSVCGDTYTADETAALGHAYENGVCTVCGEQGEQAAPLEAPVVTASNVASSGKIKLTWNAVEGAVEYHVYRSTTKDGEFKKAFTATGTSYTNTGAKATQRYYYYVVAIAADGTASEPSETISRLCDLARPVVKTSNVAETGKIKLTWAAIDGAVSYKVYCATSENGSYKLLKTVTGTTHTHLKGEAGVKYYYKVKAIAENTNANSVYSTVKSRFCDFAYPTIEVTSTAASAIRISWDKVKGATGYIIYRATSEDGEYTRLKSVTSLYGTDRTVEPDRTYYYKVVTRAENSNANSAKSPAVSAKAALPAPTLKTTANATANTIKISWSQVSNADGYYVYRRTSSNNEWILTHTVTSGSTTSFKETGVSGRFFFSVAAFETVEDTAYAGAKSNSIRARTLGKTTATLETNADELQHIVSWKAISGATGYQIYRQIGNSLTDETSSWKRIATVGEDITTYTDTVEHGTHYRYKVRAIYKYNGTTTYAPYSNTTAWGLIYALPNYSISMDDQTYSSIDGTVIDVTNNGIDTLYFFNSGSWVDATNSAYNRDIILCDYNAYVEDNVFTPMDYVAIAPGETARLLVMADSTTRYNADTQVALEMYYDGVYYVAVFCSNGSYYDFAE